MKLRTGRLCLLAAMLSCSALQAETFVLNDGGRIDGQWLNVDEKPQTKYVVRSSAGATLTLAKESVKQVVKKSPAELEYEIVRHQHPDTVAGHLALAQWCQEQKLTEIRKQHLERVLELDPNQRDARSVLGFAKIGGQWRTREQHLSSMGKIQHNGEWLYPQEIEILDRRAEQTRSRLEWTANLKRWRSWLGGDKESTARTNIAAISEPAAYAALQQLLNEEKVDAVRVMYVRALGRIGTYEALISIADRSLLDPSPDVRAISLDLLVEKPQAAIVNYFIQQLQSKDNVAVNRSAFALLRFKDKRAIAPLIDALVTKHKYAVTTGNSGGGISAMNSPNGSGINMGSSTKIIQNELNNQQVLDALITLVGGSINYQFNVEAWRQWHAGVKKNQFADARRS